MKFVRLFAILVGLGALASCATVDPLAGKVPQATWGVVRIDNPQAFLADLKKFLTPMKNAQGESLADVAFKAETWKGFPSEILDWKQPWLAAVQTNKNKKPGFTVYIPVVQGEASIQKLKDYGGKRNKAAIQLVGNYAVVSIDLGPGFEFPLESSFDLARIQPSSAIGSQGVVSYIDVQRVFHDFVPETKSFEELMEKAWEEMKDSTKSGLTKDLFVQIGRGLDQLAGLQFQAQANEQGLYFETKTDFGPGKIKDSLAEAASTKGTREYLKYLSSDALISGVFNVSPHLFDAYVDKTWEIYSQMFGLDEETLSHWKSFYTSSQSLLGNRSAFNFDLKFDQAAVQDLTENKNFTPENVRKAFSFDVTSVVETKDSSKLIGLYRDFFENDASSIFNQLLAQWKIPATVQTIWSEHVDDSGLEYKQLEFSVKVDGKKLGKDERKSINQALEAILPLFRVYFCAGPNKIYSSFGTNAFERLRTLAKNDAVDNPWSKSENYALFQQSILDNETAAIAISTPKIVQTLKELIPSNDFVAKLPSDTTGILFKGKILSSGNIEASLVVALKDIVAVISAATSLK